MILWAVAHQVPLSMGFPRQEYWSGLPFPPNFAVVIFIIGKSRVCFISCSQRLFKSYLYVLSIFFCKAFLIIQSVSVSYELIFRFSFIPSVLLWYMVTLALLHTLFTQIWNTDFSYTLNTNFVLLNFTLMYSFNT